MTGDGFNPSLSILFSVLRFKKSLENDAMTCHTRHRTGRRVVISAGFRGIFDQYSRLYFSNTSRSIRPSTRPCAFGAGRFGELTWGSVRQGAATQNMTPSVGQNEPSTVSGAGTF